MKNKLPYIIIAVIAIALIADYFWIKHNEHLADGGSVVSNDDPSSRNARMNQGAVDIDGRTTSDVDGNGQYTQASYSNGNSQPYKAPTVVSPGSSTGTTPTGTAYPTTAASAPSTSTNSYSTYKPAATTTTGADASLPTSDTLSPNAPTGMAFGGSGKFQWYRQGNLTWRINTQSGSSCIAFATMDEWAKPIVYSHGCGNA